VPVRGVNQPLRISSWKKVRGLKCLAGVKSLNDRGKLRRGAAGRLAVALVTTRASVASARRLTNLKFFRRPPRKLSRFYSRRKCGSYLRMNDFQNYTIPTVIERDGRGERVWDLFSRLLVDRIIFIGTPIDDHVSNIVVAQLLFMQMSDPKKDIHIYINSPGGSVTSGLAIYDTMQYLTCDVNTYCVGQAASMGAVLLCAGTKGKRFALPNSNIMIHQVLGGAEGQASDVEIRVKHMLKLKHTLNGILAKHTGQTIEQVEKDCDRDNFMSAEEAKNYGLVDLVVQSRKEIPGAEKV